MPPSRFVESRRLRPMVTFLAVAVVVLLCADVVLRSFVSNGDARFWLVLAWMLGVLVGAALVWRRGSAG